MSDHDGLGPEGSYFENKARREEEARRARGDAMFPVWITALYLVLGFVFGLWHPGWLLFLTIPIHYMHFDSQWERLHQSRGGHADLLGAGLSSSGCGIRAGWCSWPFPWARCIRADKAARPLSLSKKSGCAGLFRQMLKKCLRRRRKLPARPAPEGSVCPVARREACALWALGPKAQSDPKRGSETMSATVREARMIEQPGHLPPKVAKRPEGGERNERWARPAPSAKIERPGKAGRYELTLEGTEGSVCPVGTCHRRWQSAPEESTETSGGRGQRSPRRLRLRTCGPPKPPERGQSKAARPRPCLWERGRAAFFIPPWCWRWSSPAWEGP